MPQIAPARIERYLSVCCEAPIDRGAFSDGRAFLICSRCNKVLAVEPRREQKQS
jgi:hypothetical protein